MQYRGNCWPAQSSVGTCTAKRRWPLRQLRQLVPKQHLDNGASLLADACAAKKLQTCASHCCGRLAFASAPLTAGQPPLAPALLLALAQTKATNHDANNHNEKHMTSTKTCRTMHVTCRVLVCCWCAAGPVPIGGGFGVPRGANAKALPQLVQASDRGKLVCAEKGPDSGTPAHRHSGNVTQGAPRDANATALPQLAHALNTGKLVFAEKGPDTSTPAHRHSFNVAQACHA